MSDEGSAHSSGGPALSVIVPAFNEQGCIGDTIARLAAHLEGTGLRWELLVVDDGSADGTADVVRTWAARDRRVILVPGAHRGKGAAVRRGMLQATGRWRFMADADLSMPVAQLDRFLAAAAAPEAPAVIIGSREAAGASRIGEPWQRHVIGRVFNWCVQAIALPGIHDTQCGFKLFSADVVDVVFPLARLDSFAFDVELLFLARRAGARIQEVGIEWHCRRDSRVSSLRGGLAFVDVVRVRWNAWTGRYRKLTRLRCGIIGSRQ